MSTVAMTETEALVRDQLELSPEARLAALIGKRWPHYRDALSLAGELKDVAIIGGSVAAALHGAANLPVPRIDFLYRLGALPAVTDAMLKAGAVRDGVDEVPSTGERRVRLTYHGADVTARALPDGESFDGDSELLDVGPRTVRVLTAPALLKISSASEWPQERPYVDSLRAAIRLAGQTLAA